MHSDNLQFKSWNNYFMNMHYLLYVNKCIFNCFRFIKNVPFISRFFANSASKLKNIYAGAKTVEKLANFKYKVLTQSEGNIKVLLRFIHVKVFGQ